MGQKITVRVADGDAARLREIARSLGAFAPSGLVQGEPSISQLLKRIAAGQLLVVARCEGRAASIKGREE